MENVDPLRYVLLTGAGFTANWGGKLATQLWEEFYNHPKIRAEQRVKDRFKRESSFEKALASAYSGDFTESESAAVETAIFDCFKSMDDTLSDQSFINAQRIDFHALSRHLFAPLAASQTGPKGKQAYWFTLNQDIFLERHLMRDSLNGRYGPGLPGVPPCRLTRYGNSGSNRGYFMGNMPPWQAKHDDIPEPLVSFIPGTFDRTLHETNYIKLHGSFNWRKESGHNEIVIGTEKTRMIHDSRLLRWYSGVYSQVLQHSNLRMMVIGYSFLDEHINRPIFDAVLAGRLTLFIWNSSFQTIRSGLIDESVPRLPGLANTVEGEAILDAIGACSLPMNRVAPYGSNCPELTKVTTSFFSA